MAYGIKKSTNNLEEYHERIEGLRRCLRHHRPR
nr:MAG TPA: hypothetical protein [Caudoviricetes sp.]